jgi:hypothetical protein
MARTYAIDEADDMRARFVYKDDGRIDSIRILDGDGRLEGDCDDAAATMLWRAEGRRLRWFWFSLILGRAAIWRCIVNKTGERHAILWHRDHGWIENDAFVWTEEHAPDLRLRHKRWVATIAWKMLLGKLT